MALKHISSTVVSAPSRPDLKNLFGEAKRLKWSTAKQPPEGSFTISQFARENNIGYEEAKQAVAALVKTNRVASLGHYRINKLKTCVYQLK